MPELRMYPGRMCRMCRLPFHGVMWQVEITIIIILQSVSCPVHTLLHTQFCTQYITLFSPSVSSIFLFPSFHPVAAFISFPHLPTSFITPRVFPSITVTSHLPHNMSPIQLPSLHLYHTHNVPLPLDCLYFFVSHTYIRTDLLQPSPAPHFKTSPLFLFHFAKFPAPHNVTLQMYDV
jgi:hypothetical protein